MEKGLVYLWTGEGGGKTTSALGVALRALGHGKKVVIIQFLKGRKEVGEYRIKDKLGPNYEIYQFGREEFVDLSNPTKKDLELAQKGLNFAEKKLKEKPFLLVLDEINLITGPRKVKGKKVKGLIDIQDLLRLLDKIPPKTTIYLTGRYAQKRLIERADFVSEIKEIKHPMQKGIPAREGIEY